MADIDMGDWHTLIDGEIRQKIYDDFTKLQIIVEADLQSSICMYLRDFIHKHENPRWRVFNQMYQVSDAEERKHIHPDILLTQQQKRRIAIELKQAAGRKERVTLSSVIDDVKKMGVYGTKYQIQTYVIYTCYLVPETFRKEQIKLERKAAEYGEHAPNLILINIYGMPDHSVWRERFRRHLEEWTKLYPKIGD